ncbi:hypothetical protein ACFL3B_03680 [Gemmatimonadota bacterium]
MRRVVLYMVVVALFGPDRTASAQQPPLQPGERIRLTTWTPWSPEIAGTCMAVDRDTLRVLAEPDATALAIPLDSLHRLHVYGGKKSSGGNGAVLGAFVGGLGGGTLSGVLYEETECELVCVMDLEQADVILMGILTGAVLGGVVGGAVGALIKTDRWEEVPLDRLRVSFAPQRDGFALGLTYRF